MASTTTPTADAPPLGAAVPGSLDGVDDTEASALPEVLVVEVGGRRVAIPVEATREVVRLRGATRVPGAPAWVVGLLNVRGAVLAAGDLALLAGGAAATGPVVLVEAQGGGRRAGLRVDAVVGVHYAEVTVEALPHGAVTLGDGATRGLPAAGLARLTSESVAHTALSPVELPLLDVRAVLDDILEGDASL